MSLQVAVRHSVGRITLDVAMTAGRGLTALVGSSGAGKTSLLNVIAGLVRPDAGLVTLDDEVLVDTARGVWRSPHERRIGYVFQESRLFPHLTVRSNLVYGRRAGPDGIVFDDVVSLLDLGPLLSRRPSRLSGGERQRVALGRALLSSPRLLLLDEPLASVDVARRQDVLPYLDRLRVELTLPTVYVTHTWAEVESRAEQIIVLDEGRVTSVTRQEVGRPGL
jgi:molybdate transport system ATP-binding protein